MAFQAGQRPTADVFNELATGRARIVLTSSQSLANNATTKINLDSVVYDDAALWDEAGFQILIPPGFGGLYAMTASVTYAANTTGRRACDIQSNLGRLVSELAATNSAGDVRHTSSTQHVLEPGDTVWVNGFQSSGAALDVLGSATNVTHLAVARIQPL